MGLLDGKVAVITGGASGIGQATALQCAAEGARVLIADVETARATLQCASRNGAEMLFCRADVSRSSDVAALVGAAVDAHGRLDVLINAAGISGGSAPTADSETARRQFIQRQALERLGSAEEIAAAAVFLASQASSFTTGAVLAVDGGYTAQ